LQRRVRQEEEEEEAEGEEKLDPWTCLYCVSTHSKSVHGGGRRVFEYSLMAHADDHKLNHWRFRGAKAGRGGRGREREGRRKGGLCAETTQRHRHTQPSERSDAATGGTLDSHHDLRHHITMRRRRHPPRRRHRRSPMSDDRTSDTESATSAQKTNQQTPH
jgi:hypothetical protein